MRALPATVTLRDALDAYEHWRVTQAGFSIKTWAGEKPGLLGFLDAMALHDVDGPHELHHEVVALWWEHLRVGPSTKPTRLSQLRSFMRYCTTRGWLESDPTVLLRAPRVAAEPRERLTADELLTLVETARYPRDRVLLALAANLAVRGGEIARMRVGHLDLDAGEIKVYVDKTGVIDVMPLTAELSTELRSWLTVYTDTPGLSAHSYLVPARYVDNKSDRELYRHSTPIGKPYAVVKDALSRVGWETCKGEGVHTVRRSVARLYFDDVEATDTFDSALLATMELLHHERPETTLRYIGRDRAQMARDRHLKGQPFLTRLAGVRPARLHVAK